MPFKIVAEQDAFKLTTASNGLPIAEYELWGGIPYALCCPCCGMLHELPAGVQPGQVVGVKCIIKTTHPQTYAKWVKRFPEAAAYSQIVLKQRGVELSPDEQIISNPKIERKAA